MDPRLHAYLKKIIETAHHRQDIPEPLLNKMIADLHIQLDDRLMTMEPTATVEETLQQFEQSYINIVNRGEKV
ncbi:MAG: hypothetical protein WCV88_05425 [Patescibacteria group bacterium]|jgi:hypothetical protein